MAIVPSITTSYIVETLSGGIHNITDEYKLALYTSDVTLDKTTTAYSSSNECVGNNYPTGGAILTGASITVDSNTIIISFNDVKFDNITLLDVRGCMIYNATAGGRSVAVFDFGNKLVFPDSDLVLLMPPANALLGLIRYNH